VSTVVVDIPSQERGPKNDRVWFWLLSRCEARENADRIVDLSSSTF
jgi:hypothetical protein